MNGPQMLGRVSIVNCAVGLIYNEASKASRGVSGAVGVRLIIYSFDPPL